MGVWIYAKNFKKPGTDEINPDKQHLVWALITDYIRRSKLKRLVCLEKIEEFLFFSLLEVSQHSTFSNAHNKNCKPLGLIEK